MDDIMDNLPYIFYDSWENFGQKSKEVDFLNGKKDGLSTEWYENGQKRMEEYYKDGKYISEKEWNKDGSVKE